MSFNPENAVLKKDGPKPAAGGAAPASPAFNPSNAVPKGGATGGGGGGWEAQTLSMPLPVKIGLAAHDTVREKQLFLEHYYGKENVSLEWGDSSSDGMPRIFVRQDGTRKEVPSSEGLVARTAAESPMLVGMMAGGSLGAKGGAAVGGPVGALVVGVLGAGAGAAAGYQARELDKQAAGTRAKTADAAMTRAKEEFLGGATAEVGGRIIGKALTGGLPRMLTGATEEARVRFERAKDAGAMPHYLTSAPDLKKMARIEVDASKLAGKYVDQFKKNMNYVMGRIDDVMQKTGMPRQYRRAILGEVENPTAAFSGREAGLSAKKAVEATVATMEKTVDSARNAANTIIDGRLDHIDQLIKSHPAGALAEDVAALVQNAWTGFKESANSMYDAIHKSIGGAKVVPTEPIRTAAKQIIDQLLKSAHSPALREVAALGAGKAEPGAVTATAEAAADTQSILREFGIELPEGETHITLEQAQRVRSLLREKGRALNSERSVTQGDHIYVAKAVDDAIDMAAENPDVAPVIKAFRQTNQWYKDTVGKFDDATISTLREAAKSKYPMNPSQVVALITSSGKTSVVDELRRISGPEVWNRVQSQSLSNVVRDTSSIDERGNATLDGMKLLRRLSGKHGEMIEAVHGAATKADLGELGKMLAARGGKVDPSVLKDGDVKGAIATLKASEKALDAYLKQDMVRAISDPHVLPEQAFQRIVSEESLTISAAKTFANNPAVMADIRQAALEQVLRNANIHTVADTGKNVIEASLNSFTKEQQRILFPGGLASDLRELSKDIEFIFPSLKDATAAAFHAGAVLEKPAFGAAGESVTKGRLFRQASIALLRFTVLRPNVMKYIMHGFPMGPRRQILKDIVQGLQPPTISDVHKPGATKEDW